MGFLSKFFRRSPGVAYYTWHAGRGEDLCSACKDKDGACWIPEYDFAGPPLADGCTCPGGCTCTTLDVRVDEAWGPGNAEWILKRGGLVTGDQMDKFLSG